jgi:hypothetical protein
MTGSAYVEGGSGDPPLEMIAYHEAGHGVACVALRVAFLHVSVVPERRWLMLRDATYAHLPLSRRLIARNNQFIRVCGAGPLAAIIWSNYSITDSVAAGGRDDDRTARWYARVTLGKFVPSGEMTTWPTRRLMRTSRRSTGRRTYS